MLAALGTRRFDVTHDAVILATARVGEPRPGVVAATWTGTPDAVLLLADGLPPAMVAASVEEWCDAVEVPVVVRTASASTADVALAAGAGTAHDPSGLADPAYLDTVASHGASVVVGCPPSLPVDPSVRAEQLVTLAARASLVVHAPGAVVVDVTRGLATAPEHVRFLDELPAVASAGWPVMVVVAAETGADDGSAVAAAQAVVLPRGARLLPTHDVRTSRRVARVTAELLAAREAARIGS